MRLAFLVEVLQLFSYTTRRIRNVLICKLCTQHVAHKEILSFASVLARERDEMHLVLIARCW